jgi:hypothetical protein
VDFQISGSERMIRTKQAKTDGSGRDAQMVSSVDVDLAFRASGSASESKPASAFDPGVVASRGHLGVKALHVKTHRTLTLGRASITF